MVSNAYAHASLKPPTMAAKAAHCTSLVPFILLWLKMVRRVGTTYGPGSLLLSPLVGWAPMLAFGWLQLSWRPNQAQTPTSGAPVAAAAASSGVPGLDGSSCAPCSTAG